MNKSNAATLFKRMQTSIAKHSPEILTGLGVAGMITTTVLAVRATPKALRLIEEKKRDEGLDKLTPVQTVKATWKCYIPAAVSGTTSVFCILGASSVHAKRNAALATAYKLSETALTEYREKVIETIGEKKEQTVREKVAQDRVIKNAGSTTEVYLTDKGDTLFLDPVSNRQFKSDIEIIRKAVNKLNYNMTHDILGYVSLNQFYDEIGLAHSSIGDDIGWNLENGKGLLEVEFFPQITDEGKPCICLDYSVAPKYGFDTYYR